MLGGRNGSGFGSALLVGNVLVMIVPATGMMSMVPVMVVTVMIVAVMVVIVIMIRGAMLVAVMLMRMSMLVYRDRRSFAFAVKTARIV